MPNILYASRSKVSMVTATKKILSLVKGAFKRRTLDYRVVPNVFLCQLLFILTYVMISLRRQILIIGRTKHVSLAAILKTICVAVISN